MVRERSAKPLCVGSIPTRASTLTLPNPSRQKTDTRRPWGQTGRLPNFIRRKMGRSVCPRIILSPDYPDLLDAGRKRPRGHIGPLGNCRGTYRGLIGAACGSEPPALRAVARAGRVHAAIQGHCRRWRRSWTRATGGGGEILKGKLWPSP